MNVIITGATGMVGEGVLFECLENAKVNEVLIINRKHYSLSHPKLKELIVPDFFKLDEFADQLKSYEACFYCAGISSIGMDEAKYSYITYDTTMHFASTLLSLNPNMVFTFVSGSQTDSSEKGKMMWARVKGRTENALMNLGFKGQYNFRPGIMKPTKGQTSIKTSYKILIPILTPFFRNKILTLTEVGKAMIHCVLQGYKSNILEVQDIKAMGQE